MRRPRTQKLVSMSREYGRVLDCEEKGIGEDREKWTKDLAERHKWIWEKKLEEDLEEAVAMLEGGKARVT